MDDELNSSELLKIERAYIKSGHIPVFGAFAQQLPQAFLFFNRILNSYDFSQIIELGTGHGGISLFLSLYSLLSRTPIDSEFPDAEYLRTYHYGSHHKTPKEFFTFDCKEGDKNVSKIINSMGCRFEKRDILSNKTDEEYIGSLIAKKGRTLLLVDNGNKIKEFDMYSKYLKPGDIIMTHDFCQDEELRKFRKDNDICHWCEIQYKDIEIPCQRENIKQIHQKDAQDAAWFCGIKQ